MSQPAPVNRPRLLTVKHVRDVSPHLRRVCLTSPELADYPFTCGGAHIKIMLPQPGQTHAVLPTPTPQGPRWEDPSQRPIMRTFTIRAFRREALELDIDFALHGDAGPASRFAMQVKPGDLLAISGPGGPDPMLQPARHYYMVGDLTSLPAISAMTEVMPADAQGHIALLVPYQEDVQDLSLPVGVTLRWFIGTPEQTEPLVAYFTALPMQEQASYFWFGGEEGLVVPLRRHVRRTLEVDRTRVYAVPYWRHGKDEEAYHHARHDVMDS